MEAALAAKGTAAAIQVEATEESEERTAAAVQVVAAEGAAATIQVEATNEGTAAAIQVEAT